MNFLDKETFSSVIENTPLLSIDLIVKNTQDEILLGKRLNKPAFGSWFVPGGRVYKDETLEDAFKRLSSIELGEAYEINQGKFLGVYQHFYEDNVFNDNFSTHYIVLGFELVIKKKLSLDTIQHEKQKWFKKDELLKSKEVYKYVKDYVKKEKGIK